MLSCMLGSRPSTKIVWGDTDLHSKAQISQLDRAPLSPDNIQPVRVESVSIQQIKPRQSVAEYLLLDPRREEVGHICDSLYSPGLLAYNRYEVGSSREPEAVDAISRAYQGIL
jgi:hypothetical protein